MSSVSSPLVVSLGDPCGIGPEVMAKAWQALRGDQNLAFFVLGDASVLAAQGIKATRINQPAEAADCFPNALPVLDRPLSQPAIAGQPDAAHAPYIIDWIREGVSLCLDGAARGLVTAPIAKSVLYQTGFAFPGHTEFLAELCRHNEAAVPPQPVMMLTARDLRVVLATIHLPLAEVPAALSGDHLARLSRITRDALIRDFSVDTPRLVLAGLNPHAGEDGTIGREEIDLLAPVVAELHAEGMDIRGPFPADTLFHDEARRGYDAAICLYHDQGLIPLKTLDFWGGVNITLGLPIVRTSPDHGTGFNIAGQGVARPDSFINAVRTADAISRNRMLS
jgi:4-hydroxythreonine-4-phosphate dehydrogenase